MEEKEINSCLYYTKCNENTKESITQFDKQIAPTEYSPMDPIFSLGSPYEHSLKSEWFATDNHYPIMTSQTYS